MKRNSVPCPVSADPARVRSTRSKWKKRGILAGSFLLMAAVGLTCFFIWLKFYFESEGFRDWAGKAITGKLHAKATLDRIQWGHSSGSLDRLTVEGNRETLFAKIEASDIRAVVNHGALGRRRWQTDGIRAGRVLLDFSNEIPRTAEPPKRDPKKEDKGGGGADLFGFLMPNRTVVKSVIIDHLDALWSTGGYALEVSGVALQIKPADGLDAFPGSGYGGTLTCSALPKMRVTIGSFDAALKDGNFTLHELHALSKGAAISAAGEVRTGERPSLIVSGTVAGLNLVRVIPDGWMKRLTGKAGGTVQVTGDPNALDRLLWRGIFRLHENCVLEGLPVLEVIARKTQNNAFLRLSLREASTDFTRTPAGGWLLERITVDAPGLMRLKGNVSLDPGDSLRGELLAGVVPGTLRNLAGAEKTVFLPLDQLTVTPVERALLTTGDSALLWTRLRLGGTLEKPEEDLAERLSQAWFHANLEEVLKSGRGAPPAAP